jgi:hypothetical protein
MALKLKLKINKSTSEAALPSGPPSAYPAGAGYPGAFADAPASGGGSAAMEVDAPASVPSLKIQFTRPVPKPGSSAPSLAGTDTSGSKLPPKRPPPAPTAKAKEQALEAVEKYRVPEQQIILRLPPELAERVSNNLNETGCPSDMSIQFTGELLLFRVYSSCAWFPMLTFPFGFRPIVIV